MNPNKISCFMVLFPVIVLLPGINFIRTTVAGPSAEEATIEARISDLEKFDQLAEVFNKGEGKVRLVTLLSPT